MSLQPEQGGQTQASDDVVDVVQFWREAGFESWFRKSDAFDQQFRERFLALHERAAKGELDDWANTADGTLALLILLDQFPRNAFRGFPRMYATDERALHIARQAIKAGLDKKIDATLRVFVYLPFSHSENLSDQRVAVELNETIGQPWLTHAVEHEEIVEKFGRFPHRNALLGRETTEAERKYLESGGFAG